MLFFTKTALGNLLRKSSTRMYPHVVREPFNDARGELINDIDKCIFCMKCSKVCPSQCITVDNKAATWECDPFACVYCSVCVDNCPVGSLHMKPAYKKGGYEREIIHMQGEIKRKKAASAQKAAPDAAAEASPRNPGGAAE